MKPPRLTEKQLGDTRLIVDSELRIAKEEKEQIADSLTRAIYCHIVASCIDYTRVASCSQDERNAAAEKIRSAKRSLNRVSKLLEDGVAKAALNDARFSRRTKSPYGTAENGLPNLPAVNSQPMAFDLPRKSLVTNTCPDANVGPLVKIEMQLEQAIWLLPNIEIKWHLARIEKILNSAIVEVAKEGKPNKADRYMLLTGRVYEILRWNHQQQVERQQAMPKSKHIPLKSKPNTDPAGVFVSVLEGLLAEVLGDHEVKARTLVVKLFDEMKPDNNSIQ